MRKLNDESLNFRMVKRYTDLLFAVYPNTVLIRTSTTKERYPPLGFENPSGGDSKPLQNRYIRRRVATDGVKIKKQ